METVTLRPVEPAELELIKFCRKDAATDEVREGEGGCIFRRDTNSRRTDPAG